MGEHLGPRARASQPDGEGVVDPGGSIDLATSRHLVRIAEGRAEVYATVGGRRRFLAEFVAGDVAFGGTGGGSAPLRLVLPEGGRIETIEIDAVLGALDDPFRASSLLSWTDRWVAQISTGLARYAPSRPDVVGISAGDLVALEPDGGVMAGTGVVWLAAPEEAALSLLGLAPVLARAVPLTSAFWCTLPGGGDVAAMPTIALLRQPDWPDCLSAFHGALVTALTALAETEEAAEAERIAVREAGTEEELVAVHARLGSVLRTGLPGRKDRVMDGDCAYVMSVLAPDAPALPADRAAPVEIAAYARALGFRTREVRLPGAWYRQDRGPLAGRRLADERPVALRPDWRGRYRMHLRGEPPRLVTALVAAELDVFALSLLAPLPNRALKPSEVLRLGIGLCRFDVSTIIAAGLLGALLGLVLPIATGRIVDLFIPGHLRGGLIELGIALAVLTAGGAILRLASELARVRMDGRLSGEIMGGFMDRILRLPSGVLRAYTSADLTQRLISFDQIRRTITNTVLGTFASSMFGLSGILLLFVYSWPAALVAVALVAILLACAVGAGRAQVKALASGEAMTASVSSLVLQLIQNVSMLRVFGAERRAFGLWASNAATMRSRMLRARRYLHGFDAFLAAYDTLALAVIFAVLGYGGGAAGITTGGYLAFIAAYQGFQIATSGVSRAIVLVLGVQPILKRAELILTNVPENTPTARDPGPLSGAVEVSHLAFAYVPGLPVLDGVSFDVEPGAFVAVTGPSGCGKSTLVNLIVGLDSPAGGSILFDGQDLSSLDRTAVRRQIGIVRQNGKLFGGSILDNILGTRGGGVEDAWWSAENAGIADEIAALPMGMHTVLSEGVSTFSGGQVQRLLLARALVGRPRILILDEATSALDNATQSLVTRRLEGLGLTRIIVAHRLSSVRNADTILFLERGRVLEAGSYDELVAAGGSFAAFASRQVL